MKALVGAFNQEKALVGAFSVIVKTGCGSDGALHSTSPGSHQVSRKYCVQSPSICAKLVPGRCLVFICVTDNCSDCQQRITIRGAPTQHFTISTLAPRHVWANITSHRSLSTRQILPSPAIIGASNISRSSLPFVSIHVPSLESTSGPAAVTLSTQYLLIYMISTHTHACI